MFPGLSTEIIIDILDTLGFGFLFTGVVCSFAFIFLSKRTKWMIFASLSFLASAASFSFLSWISPVFAWDVVPIAVIDIIFLVLCLKAGTQSP